MTPGGPVDETKKIKFWGIGISKSFANDLGGDGGGAKGGLARAPRDFDPSSFSAIPKI